jgi:hypothetical protein
MLEVASEMDLREARCPLKVSLRGQRDRSVHLVTNQILSELDYTCEALEARKDRIPWYGEGPMRLDLMCKGTREGPLPIPLHPAAEAFWRKQGYL